MSMLSHKVSSPNATSSTNNFKLRFKYAKPKLKGTSYKHPLQLESLGLFNCYVTSLPNRFKRAVWGGGGGLIHSWFLILDSNKNLAN